ncbi:MAG: ABC transporter ATP-binding protein/permease [Chloroflexi bacterium]|nr:ABC transporter ATP-binding protein/permease [Chloroflexota bacterium]
MSSREQLPTASGAAARHAARELARPYARRASLTLVVLVAGTATSLVAPPLLGRVVDLVVDERPASAITVPVLLLLAVTILGGALTALGMSLVARVGEPMLATLRERVVQRVLALPLGQVERAGRGDLLARVGDDVGVIADAVRNALPALASAGLMVGLTVVGLAVLDWRLALAGLVAAPVQLLTLRWYLRVSTPVYAAERAAGSGRAQQLVESIGGVATVRAYGLSDEHEALIAARSRDANTFALRTVRMQTRFFAQLNCAEWVGTTAILVAGFLLVRDGAVSIGEATAAALYFVRLYDPLNVLLGLFDEAQAAVAGLARLVGITDLPQPAEPETPGVPRDASVRATGLHHAYVSGREVLRDVSITISPGERVALVGVSGAGKTTLAKLISGIHEPTRGQVLLGGVPISRLGAAATRRTVGLITQEVHVFAGPLADDLRLARPSATDEELWQALERAGAGGWASRLPDGLQTAVGEGGHRLSAAQAQQLALARLALADPPIAILDEATADAGSAGARELELASARVLEGRTALVVAHRLTQAASADRVLVLDAGVLRESGTHAELLNAGGPYAELWAAWAQAR